MPLSTLDKIGVLLHEGRQLGALGHDIERGRDHLGDIFLTGLWFHAIFLVVVRVALHVELAERLQIVNFGLQLGNTLNL